MSPAIYVTLHPQSYQLVNKFLPAHLQDGLDLGPIGGHVDGELSLLGLHFVSVHDERFQEAHDAVVGLAVLELDAGECRLGDAQHHVSGGEEDVGDALERASAEVVEVLDEVWVLDVGLGGGGEESERGVAEDGEDVEDDGAAAGGEERGAHRLLVAAVLADEHASAVDVASDAGLRVAGEDELHGGGKEREEGVAVETHEVLEEATEGLGDVPG